MPYKKPNAKIMYVNKNSSHPKTIIKQIPNIINERLNKRSSKEENFLKIKDEYELIMKNVDIMINLNMKTLYKNLKITQNIKEK